MNHTLRAVPGLLSGRTDSANFANLAADGIFRFMPFSMNITNGDNNMVHGNNERVQISAFVAAIRFYIHALQTLSAAPGTL